MSNNLTWLLLGTLLFLAGCTAATRQAGDQTLRPDTDAYLAVLDQIAQQYEVGDASHFPVPGFPHLRCNRFLSAMGKRLDNPVQQQYWIRQMQAADLESRRKEIDNLPPAALRELSLRTGLPADADTCFQMAVQSSNQMLNADRKREGYHGQLADAAVVPDEYSTAMRFFLLYPVVAMPVSVGAYNFFNKIRQWHNTPPEQLEVIGRLTPYTPHERYGSFDPLILKQLFATDRKDAFGLPQWNAEEVLQLAGMFAPVITQDVTEDYDRFGAVHWREGRVSIDHHRPVVYFYVSYAFFKQAPVVQMNYALWYSERAGENAPSIERGPLDGLTFRLTFNSDGSVVMADSMNSCGCSHFFIPAKDRVEKVVLRERDFDPLVPTWLPRQVPGRRVDLRISSGWHQVQHVGAFEDTGGGTSAYDLQPYGLLESLPGENGRRASVFNSAGIMKDSWRVEPYVFFSMGIPKVGYMRQRGHHATKLIGREHFTNPHLFDRNFIFR